MGGFQGEKFERGRGVPFFLYLLWLGWTMYLTPRNASLVAISLHSILMMAGLWMLHALVHQMAVAREKTEGFHSENSETPSEPLYSAVLHPPHEPFWDETMGGCFLVRPVHRADAFISADPRSLQAAGQHHAGVYTLELWVRAGAAPALQPILALWGTPRADQTTEPTPLWQFHWTQKGFRVGDQESEAKDGAWVHWVFVRRPDGTGTDVYRQGSYVFRLDALQGLPEPSAVHRWTLLGPGVRAAASVLDGLPPAPTSTAPQLLCGPFDKEAYRAAYPEIDQTGEAPETHWASQGIARGRLGYVQGQAGRFDPIGYLARNPDLPATISGQQHYQERGYRENRTICIVPDPTVPRTTPTPAATPAATPARPLPDALGTRPAGALSVVRVYRGALTPVQILEQFLATAPRFGLPGDEARKPLRLDLVLDLQTSHRYSYPGHGPLWYDLHPLEGTPRPRPESHSSVLPGKVADMRPQEPTCSAGQGAATLPVWFTEAVQDGKMAHLEKPLLAKIFSLRS